MRWRFEILSLSMFGCQRSQRRDREVSLRALPRLPGNPGDPGCLDAWRRPFRVAPSADGRGGGKQAGGSPTLWERRRGTDRLAGPRPRAGVECT